MKHFLRLLLFTFISVLAVSQSITSGDISGVVTDPSGAVVPNAKVTAVSDATGETHTANSNGQGVYRFSFLKPGSYTVTATSAGLQAASHKVQVGIGQVATANIGMTLTAARQLWTSPQARCRSTMPICPPRSAINRYRWCLIPAMT
jgi:hypothetical protein